ncbi:hypothetical protein EMGBS2_02580, partial [Actinomycetota bacterium]
LRSIANKTDKKEELDFAIKALKTLEVNGVSAANPKNWVGAINLSTHLPVVTDEEVLRFHQAHLNPLLSAHLSGYLNKWWQRC